MSTFDETYQVLGTLATGGTAVLHKAVQISLDRPVVIKRLHTHLTADPDFTRRFHLEAKAAARLDHDNIVRIIDFGADGGEHYIVMEYIDGPSLKDVLAARRVLDDELTLLVAREICLGLDHAHRRGVIHRDIKPANIMIARDGRVVITDFGLAKLRHPEMQETVASTLLGTPLYMSPEQAIGESIDGRSDLFSLGTICYEALTGTQPFLGETYAAVIQRILHGVSAGPRRQKSDVRPETEAIVMKALARDPAKRFRDAAEMARLIESTLGRAVIASARGRLRLLAGEKEHAPRRTAPRIRRRRRRPAAGALAAAAATAALLVVAALRSGGISELSRSIRVGFADPLAPRPETMQGGMAEPFAGITMTPVDVPAPPADTLPAADAPGRPADDSSAAVAGPAEALESVEAAPLQSIPSHTAALNAAEPPIISFPVAAIDSSAPPERPSETAAPRSTARPVAAPARTGFIDIVVDPPASILIDGEPQTANGRLAMFELEAGPHEIVCRREGYREYVETVKIANGELSRRRIELREIAGSLEIHSERGAQLFIDGVFSGALPLAKAVSLSPGSHRVLLKKPGYRAWSADVHVPSDEPLRLSIRLVPDSQSE